MNCFVDLQRLTGVLAGLLTPTIGGIAVYIAYQQHVTNKRHLRLALYDKRMFIFEATTKLIRSAANNMDVAWNDIFIFAWETRECEFLFGPDIVKYLKEVEVRAAKMHENVLTDHPSMVTEHVTWFIAQLNEAKKRFGRYMMFPEAF
jgi:hypothetical protein